MSQHQDQSQGIIKNYTLTTLFSFSIMFILFVTLSRCHGSYHPVSEHSTTNEHKKAEHHK